MKYSAYIDGVGNEKCDPKIDAIDFEDENEAKQFVIDEFKDKWGADLSEDQVSIFENASQR
jgi:hypothetical protein